MEGGCHAATWLARTELGVRLDQPELAHPCPSVEPHIGSRPGSGHSKPAPKQGADGTDVRPNTNIDRRCWATSQRPSLRTSGHSLWARVRTLCKCQQTKPSKTRRRTTQVGRVHSRVGQFRPSIGRKRPNCGGAWLQIGRIHNHLASPR